MDMREQVVKFEKFIQENDAKRVRAEAKAKQVFRSYSIIPRPPPPLSFEERLPNKGVRVLLILMVQP